MLVVGYHYITFHTRNTVEHLMMMMILSDLLSKLNAPVTTRTCTEKYSKGVSEASYDPIRMIKMLDT